MNVFRVAHTVSRKHGAYPSGPYSQRVEPELPAGTVENLIRPMGYAHSDDPCHPSPVYDTQLWSIAVDEVCGMTDRPSLNEWFDGWRGRLKRYGYQVYVYEVPDEDVRVGSFGQCVFRYENARLIRTEEVTA